MLDTSKTLHDLENLELLSPDGAITPQLYSKLLALYLLRNELCSAKYLWKRIPDALKTQCTDLTNIWAVGKKMWLRDWPGAHLALKAAAEWDEEVREVMDQLRICMRDRALALVGEAYSSLEAASLANMTGVSEEEAQELAVGRGWEVEEKIVRPMRAQKVESREEEIGEDQLDKLTQFVSFLEN